MATQRSTDATTKATSPTALDEEKAINSFFEILQDHLVSASQSNRHKDAWRGAHQNQYVSELQILKEHYTPLIWGFGSAASCFLAFRASRSRTFRAYQARRDAGRGGTGKGFEFDRMRGAPDRTTDMPHKQELVGEIASIPVDLSLSLLIGCSATLFLTDKDKLQRDLARLPLVPGRSLVSDELCADFVKEYYNYPEDGFWNDEKSLRSHPSLGAIKEFVRNCEKRNAYEQKLRNNGQVFSSCEHVVVPSPGVPVNDDCDNDDCDVT